MFWSVCMKSFTTWRKNHILQISEKEKRNRWKFYITLVDLQGCIRYYDAEKHLLWPVSCFVLWGIMRSNDQHSPHFVCRCYSQSRTLALPSLCLPFCTRHLQFLLCGELMWFLTFHFLSSSCCCLQVIFPYLSLVVFSLKWIIWQFSCHRGLLKVGHCFSNCPRKKWQCHWYRQPLSLFITLSVYVTGFGKCAGICCHVYRLTV